MSREHTYCFIINCASNSFKAESFFRNKEHFLLKHFPKADFVYVQENDSIAEIAFYKSQKYTHIIACGGDGTVNQIVNGIIDREVTLGVIPLGSGNDFAKSIGLDNDFDSNIKVLKNKKIRRLDIIETEWGHFINTFGIGVDGLTNYYASKSHYKSGSAKYFMGGLKALLMAKPFLATISIDGQENIIKQKSWMVVVANGKTEGGKYKISPSSVNDDEKIEVVLVKAVWRVRLIIAFLKLSMGFNFNKTLVEEFKCLNACSVNIDEARLAHADGEYVSEKKAFDFTLKKSALSVITA